MEQVGYPFAGSYCSIFFRHVDMGVVILIERVQAVIHDDGVEETIQHAMHLVHGPELTDVYQTTGSISLLSVVRCHTPVRFYKPCATIYLEIQTCMHTISILQRSRFLDVNPIEDSISQIVDQSEEDVKQRRLARSILADHHTHIDLWQTLVNTIEVRRTNSILIHLWQIRAIHIRIMFALQEGIPAVIQALAYFLQGIVKYLYSY